MITRTPYTRLNPPAPVMAFQGPIIDAINLMYENQDKGYLLSGEGILGVSYEELICLNMNVNMLFNSTATVYAQSTQEPEYEQVTGDGKFTLPEGSKWPDTTHTTPTAGDVSIIGHTYLIPKGVPLWEYREERIDGRRWYLPSGSQWAFRSAWINSDWIGKIAGRDYRVPAGSPLISVFTDEELLANYLKTTCPTPSHGIPKEAWQRQALAQNLGITGATK